MSNKRIIPCLDIKEGRAVKGVNFKGLRDAGDPVELAKRYVEEGADELVFLDITATLEKRKTLVGLVQKIAEEINIPFTVGGGIKSLKDAETVLKAGADKVTLSSAAVNKPELISEIAEHFGSQSVVVAIDYKNVGQEQFVFVKGGSEQTELKLLDWIKQVGELGAGEILLTAMDRDGTKEGFDLETLSKVNKTVGIPVIASGGAGKIDDFVALFQKTATQAGLAASIFHYGEISIQALKKELQAQNIPVS